MQVSKVFKDLESSPWNLKNSASLSDLLRNMAYAKASHVSFGSTTDGQAQKPLTLISVCTEAPALLLPGGWLQSMAMYASIWEITGLEISKLGGPQLPATAEYSDHTGLASIEAIFKISKISVSKTV